MKYCTFLFFISLLLITPLSLFTRPVEILSYEDMLEKSDLVIIGKVISTCDQPDFSFDNCQDDSWIQVYTTFQILSVIKGNLEDNIIILQHYRYYNEEMVMIITDGPSFIKFVPDQSDEFLLYLIEEEHPERNNIYSPVSGQYDPDLSIRRLKRFFE